MRPADRGVLTVVLAGTFMTVLDFFIVNVAIPSLGQDLSAGPAAIQWIIAGYGIPYGAGLITGGKLGDLYGRRRLFMLGLAAFTLASAGCGLAPSSSLLVAARVAQGAGAALLAPQVLAIMNTTFTGSARARAFTVYGVVLGLAAVFGQLIGGLLIQANPFGLGWRACFLINIPIGIAALLGARRLVPESTSDIRARLDVRGMLLVSTALVATVLPLIQGRQQGWPLWSWLSLAAAAALFAILVAQQRRRAVPLIDPVLVRERVFTAGLLAQLVFWMGQAAFFLVFALYVQQGRGMGPLAAGTIFFPLGAGYMATSLSARRLATRFGHQVIGLGALIMIAGEIGLLITVNAIGVDGQAAWLIPALVIDGAGMGMAIAPLASTALARVEPRHAGAASGVLFTAQQVGNPLGVALVGILFYSTSSDSLGFERATIYLIAVSLAVAGLAQLIRQPRTRAGSEASSAKSSSPSTAQSARLLGSATAAKHAGRDVEQRRQRL